MSCFVWSWRTKMAAACGLAAVVLGLPLARLAQQSALAAPPPFVFQTPFVPGVSPEATVAELVLGMMACDEQRVLAVTLPHPEEAVLWQSAGPRASPLAVAQAALAMPNMPFERLKPGDVVSLPSGEQLVLDARHVNDQRLMITFPENPLPFAVVREGKTWKVDASLLIAARRLGLNQADAEGASTATIPNWQPEAEAAEALGPNVAFGAYTLRPPAGYKPRDLSTAGGRVFVWEGAPRPDGTRPRLLANLVPLPKDQADVTLQRHLHNTLRQAIASQRDDFQRSESHLGRIGGLTFARATWTAATRPEPQKPARALRGAMYVAVDGPTAVVLMYEEPSREDALLRTLEAAIRSFARQSPGR